MKVFDEKLQKQLEDISFAESASTNPVTQNALLESLESDQTEGRFKNAEDMFSHMMKEWEDENQ